MSGYIFTYIWICVLPYTYTAYTIHTYTTHAYIYTVAHAHACIYVTCICVRTCNTLHISLSLMYDIHQVFLWEIKTSGI